MIIKTVMRPRLAQRRGRMPSEATVRTGEERNIIMFRARSARPQAISCVSEIAEVGPRKTAMRFIRGWPSAFCVPVPMDGSGG